MKSSEFITKFKSRYLWGNLTAMALTVLLLCAGVKYGLDIYTHHGEFITIPNLRHKSFDDAQYILNNMGLRIVVVDTGYVKRLPPGCILGQSPAPGEHVKSGHIIYVTINASQSPTITLPDVIDNSSLREAMAKLQAMGFILGTPKHIPGEKDWVYGILVNGRHVVAGDKISVEDSLVILVGNGLRSEEDSVNYVDPNSEEYKDDEGGTDEFQEVTSPDEPATPPSTPVSEKGTEPKGQK